MLTTVGVAVRVTTPGVPVRIIDFAPLADTNSRVHGVMLQVLPGNTGIVYVGTLGVNRSTYANVLAFLAIPTVNFIPTFSAALTIAPNAIGLDALYIDADVAQNGVIVTYLVT